MENKKLTAVYPAVSHSSYLTIRNSKNLENNNAAPNRLTAPHGEFTLTPIKIDPLAPRPQGTCNFHGKRLLIVFDHYDQSIYLFLRMASTIGCFPVR